MCKLLPAPKLKKVKIPPILMLINWHTSNHESCCKYTDNCLQLLLKNSQKCHIALNIFLITQGSCVISEVHTFILSCYQFVHNNSSHFPKLNIQVNVVLNQILIKFQAKLLNIQQVKYSASQCQMFSIAIPRYQVHQVSIRPYSYLRKQRSETSFS